MDLTRFVLSDVPSEVFTYLGSVEREKRATPRSWLYERFSTETIIAKWVKRLETLDDRYRDLIQYEKEFLGKMGPQGGHASWRELSSLARRGFADHTPLKVFSSEEWATAKERVRSEIVRGGIAKNSVRPRSVDNVIRNMHARDTLYSSAGFPSMGKRSNKEIQNAAKADSISGKWLDYPALPLWRTYNGKTRLVWMYPMATNIHEATFLQPLQELLMEKSFPFLTVWKGYEAAKLKLSDAMTANSFVASSDFAHTDETFTRFHTLEVFDVIKDFFPPSYRAELKESMEWINFIPLLTPRGYLLGEHGVSSGSGWTNFVETIFDWTLSHYLVIKGMVRQPFMGIGDDMAHDVEPKAWATFAKDLEDVGKAFGLEINASKTRTERDFSVFLQRIMIKGVRARVSPSLAGIYRITRALNSSLFPEKFHNPKVWSSDMFCVRQYMILENLVDHPLFEEFVRWTVKGQKDLLAFARLQKKELEKKLALSRKLPGLVATYNQEKRGQSLDTFESIKIARSI